VPENPSPPQVSAIVKFHNSDRHSDTGCVSPR
jgi:hypothetical protein